MNDGFFRSKKGYTTVQNYITFDNNVSLKALGLYLLIQARITHPTKKLSKKELKTMVKDGEKSFNSAWDELKEKGYLHIHFYSEKRSWRVEYDLLEQKQEGPHTFYYNSNGKLTKTNLDRNNTKEEACSGERRRTCRFGSNADGSNADGSNVNGSNADGSSANGSNANGSNVYGSSADGRYADGRYANGTNAWIHIPAVGMKEPIKPEMTQRMKHWNSEWIY